MMIALIIMPLVVMFGPGGTAGGSLAEVPVDGFLSFTEGLTLLGFISAVTWGLGYFGQPHIIVRFMAIDTVKKVARARTYGLSWMAVSLLGAVGMGLAGRAYAERNGLVVEDAETIFIVLAELLFHPAVTGFLFAALLAAIMSTISSQLLVSSSSLTEDFYRLFLRKNASEREAVNVGRICVALVAVAAIIMASDPNSQVLGLVANAWAGFGAAFGPLIILALTWRGMTGAGAVAGLVTGAVVAGGWIAMGWNSSFMGGEGLYEIVPGFIAAWIAIVVVSKATEGNNPMAQPAQ
jgi:SSS family solute:Na+ symporter